MNTKIFALVLFTLASTNLSYTMDDQHHRAKRCCTCMQVAGGLAIAVAWLTGVFSNNATQEPALVALPGCRPDQEVLWHEGERVLGIFSRTDDPEGDATFVRATTDIYNSIWDPRHRPSTNTRELFAGTALLDKDGNIPEPMRQAYIDCHPRHSKKGD